MAEVLDRPLTSVAAAGERGDVLTIRPPTRWGTFALSDVWHHRELLFFLCKRDLQIRYKQSLLGVAWAVMQPVALALIFWVFFGRLASVPHENVPYPVFSLAALVAWNFCSMAVTQASGSLVADANLLAKVYFPRLVVPIAKIGSIAVDMVVALGVLAIFMIGYGIAPAPQVVLLPLFLLLGAFVAFGFGTFFAALNVKYRDIQVAVPLVVQMWLFLTPVVYPASLVGGAWQYLYAVNPLVAVVSGARWAILGTKAPSVATILISVGVTIALVVGALVYFRRTERYFADVI